MHRNVHVLINRTELYTENVTLWKLHHDEKEQVTMPTLLVWYLSLLLNAPHLPGGSGTC